MSADTARPGSVSGGRSPQQIQSQGRDGLVFAGLLLLMFWLPIPYGSHRPWAEAVFELAVGGLMLIWLSQFVLGQVHVSQRLLEAFLPLAIWTVWLLWIFLQTVNLPVETLSAFAPLSATYYETAYRLLGLSAATAQPISIGIDVTRQGLHLSLGYFCLYVLVLLTGSDSRRLRMLALAILFSGLLQALYGGFMVLSGVEYGFLHKKVWYQGMATGTFVNRNHLAGYLEISLAVGVGLLLSQLRHTDLRSWRERLLSFLRLFSGEKLRLRIFLAIMVLALILTRSRMGNSAFFVSLTICGLFYVFLRERRLFVSSMLLFVSLLVVDAWILGSWFGLDELVERLQQTNLQTETRTALFSDLLPMMDAYWRTGSGLGTFFLAYPAFRSEQVEFFNDYAHNDYAQFIIETGLVGASLLGLLALVTVIRALRIIWVRHDRLVCGIAFGTLMSVTALAIHSLTDFNLQIPANAATLVVVMAMTAACSPRSNRKRRSKKTTAGNDEAAMATSLPEEKQKMLKPVGGD